MVVFLPVHLHWLYFGSRVTEGVFLNLGSLWNHEEIKKTQLFTWPQLQPGHQDFHVLWKAVAGARQHSVPVQAILVPLHSSATYPFFYYK